MDWVSGRSSVPDLAQQRHGADCQKPTLRFGLWQRLMPGVRRTSGPSRTSGRVTPSERGEASDHAQGGG